MKKLHFVLTDSGILRFEDITSVDMREIDKAHATATDRNGTAYQFTGIAALELVWTLKPSSLEGNPNIRWAKHSWIVHNLIGHPLMQIVAFFGTYKLAMHIHDSTVPKPKGIK